MNRFYSMLREASRLQPGTPSEQESTDIPQTVPPVLAAMLDQAAPAKPVAAAMPASAPDSFSGPAAAPTPEPNLNITPEELFDLALFPEKGKAAENGSWGTAAQLTFPRSAPLLPHAMHSVVVERYRRLRTKI